MGEGSGISAALESSGQEVIVVDRLKVVCCVGTATKRLAIPELLNVAKPRRDAAVAVGVIAIKRDGNRAISARIHLVLIEDGLNVPVNHLWRLTAVGVEEEAIRICFILWTVDIAITQGQFKIRGNLAAPLGHRFLLGVFDGDFDGVDRRGI